MRPDDENPDTGAVGAYLGASQVGGVAFGGALLSTP